MARSASKSIRKKSGNETQRVRESPDYGVGNAVKVADFAQERNDVKYSDSDKTKTACQNGYWVASIYKVVKMPFSQAVHTKYFC